MVIVPSGISYFNTNIVRLERASNFEMQNENGVISILI